MIKTPLNCSFIRHMKGFQSASEGLKVDVDISFHDCTLDTRFFDRCIHQLQENIADSKKNLIECTEAMTLTSKSVAIAFMASVVVGVAVFAFCTTWFEEDQD